MTIVLLAFWGIFILLELLLLGILFWAYFWLHRKQRQLRLLRHILMDLRLSLSRQIATGHRLQALCNTTLDALQQFLPFWVRIAIQVFQWGRKINLQAG